ncbi:uncharacterized protein LOC62_02G002561 [Vanrija pseudolonga]|uniref:Uncharacterized protein n=1 Tax=Vanrija pseudolonga TaxID=143232 RepID=A0AAF0Y2D8_9TREE|nr:hypothetical protein LOC62_02G002561 [Vanrija pseudolonga]
MFRPVAEATAREAARNTSFNGDAVTDLPALDPLTEGDDLPGRLVPRSALVVQNAVADPAVLPEVNVRAVKMPVARTWRSTSPALGTGTSFSSMCISPVGLYAQKMLRFLSASAGSLSFNSVHFTLDGSKRCSMVLSTGIARYFRLQTYMR